MFSIRQIANDIIGHWRNDWRNNRPLFWLELFGTIGSIAGTVTLSVFINAAPLFLAYCFWLFGSSILAVSAYMRRAGWFFVLMAFNTAMNIVAMYLLVYK